MANLGFSMDTDFKARPDRRHRVGTGVPNVESLIMDAPRRAPIEIYIGLAVIGAAIATMLFPDRAALLLSQLKALL
ncbi:hypothetical protein K9U39_05940 [Rhodoblastus acidophilus]|uniref:Uncharacterized protein n=1 Tax=Candidatus Rhodoblastus alkanivorans TaxID=2954117 RepID=A0ABS9Z6W4_9HYPH|nr:hypothetical protein [Candidatus Rhodoblastus alkanivorans]MCI4679185.1 hypothetical protein [Candidatus Rhodoblastus alkanivorans]MCI4683181.1 hypothetical protein [Candidatus Rhodoblastus alkanivorans]MDI4640493.1 hypothetical protein [Rhodoblastus acidophilus]